MKIRSTVTVALSLLVAAALSSCESTSFEAESVSISTRTAMNVLPLDARYVGMIDVASMGKNPQFSVANALTSLQSVESEANARIKDFLSATGFDPQTDLQSIYVGANDHTVPTVVAYASYDLDKVIDFLDTQLGSHATKSTYRDLTTYEFTDNDETGALGLAGESMIIAGSSLASVQAALDRILDGTGVADAEVMNLVGKVSGASAWFVAADIPRDGLDDDQLAQTLAAVDKIAVAVNAGADEMSSTTYLTPGNDLAAKDLADLVKGAVAMLKIEAQDRPDALELLDDVRVRTDGGDVRVDFAVPNGMFAALHH